MAEGLVRKKKVRAGHKGSATRMLNQIDTILSSEAPDVSKLSQLKLSIQEKLETIKQLDGEILELIEEDDLATEIEQADSFKEGIYSSMIRIDKCTTARAVPATPPTPPPSDPRAFAPRDRDRVKLPKLTLRPFNGERTQWTTFWESYESAIHLNKDLSDIDKFNYLNSLLERTAREAIAGLALSSANYNEAVAILKKRFGNKQQIIAKHMDILLNLEAVTSSHNLRALRHLYDLTESHVRSLKSLGVESSSYGSMLSSVLLNKLPSDLRLIVSRKVPESDWNLDSLLKIVEEEIVARERVEPKRVEQKPSQPPPRRSSERSPSTATTLVASSSPSSPTCCYCQQPHPSNSCSNVTQIDARKQILKGSGRCFCCLRKGHISRECRSPRKCPKCAGRHHISICPRNHSSDASRSSIESSVSQPEPTGVPGATKPGLNPNATAFATPPTSVTMCAGVDKSVLLQTAQATVYNPQKPQLSLRVRAILDSGSQRSYVTNKIKSALSLTPEGTQMLSIASFGSEGRQPTACEVVHIAMKTNHGVELELTMFSVPHICEPLRAQPISLCAINCDHLAQLELADSCCDKSTLEVDMLIGSDYYWDLATGEIRRGKGGPVAINTKLGWVLSGPAPPNKQESTHKATMNLLAAHTLRIDAEPSDTHDLDDCLRSFWELESLGIKKTDKSVYEEFSEKIRLVEGRYEVSLPWKETHAPLPDNRLLSSRRLEGLLRRLRENSAILREYDSIIRDQIEKKIVEVITEPDTRTDLGHKVHYLPHHAVIRHNKETTKLRVVYDASARSGGPSLNDCLYTGPKFNQKIMDILLRFRSYPIALTADIEKAFLMISVAKEDRDALRFLWVDDITSDNPEVVTLRFARVVFGVSSSPFLLNATIKHHLEKFASSHPRLVSDILQSIYVDDIVFGASDEDSAYELYASSKEMLKKGSFNLRKFATNSLPLQERINQAEGISVTPHVEQSCSDTDETYAKSTLGNVSPLRPEEQRILGVRWNIPSDFFVFSFDDVATIAVGLEPTKRNVVATVGRFYDPLGFISPIVIRFKLLFQELCEAKVSWDLPLEGELLRSWHSLIADLLHGQPVSIPRCYFDGVSSEVKTYELCGFCDASTRAYAAVVYLVMHTDTGRFVQFVVSKTRVAPVQRQTVPRLELLSALLLARLVASVTEALTLQLTLNPPKCFTDSKVALFWIRGLEKEWKQFIQNRVNEIRKLVPSECWDHCPGQENPADMPSRGITTSELAASKLWRSGPEWLRSGMVAVNCPQELLMPTECAAELRARDKVVHGLLNCQLPTPADLELIISSKRYSTLARLLRVTAYVLRFVNQLKKTTNERELMLTPEEIAEAERVWIIQSQSKLTRDKQFDIWRKQFGLFLDEKGIWRCGGRLENAAIPYGTKHPVILSKHHFLTTLVVRNAHERVMHNGVKDTLTEVRSKFWIVGGRSFVKSVLHNCVICRRFESKPYQNPLPPPLPTFRVSEDPPFSSTGVDFAGPLYIRQTGSTASKVWICLYTCCTTRAIHLDIVPDMSTQTFINSLKRFCARRGLPRQFISDNGKTFKAAAKVMEGIVSQRDVQQYLSQVRVKWLFNLERAPWWGGVFERMVRSTKRCLRKMIGQAKFSFDELLTAVTEVEAIVNSRPLSYVTSDDVDEPLTPSHLLIGRRVLSLPDDLSYHGEITVSDFKVTPTSLSRRVKYLNGVLNQFWRRWRNEYLLELRDAHRNRRGASTKAPIAIGDLVLIHDESQPRGFWRLAKVEDTIVGKDGQIRGAKLRVSARGGQSTSLQRPLSLLYPLEINCYDDDSESTSNAQVIDRNEIEADSEPAVTPIRRSSRLASSQATDRIKACMAELEDT